jgi:soluble lytic murein transglycosylase-like protein
MVALGLALWLGLASAAPSYGAEALVEPVSIDQIVDEAAARFGLPPLWIHAVIAAESGGDAGAVSPKGAMGLMQLMPGTWRLVSAQHQLGRDPFDRRANVLAGAAYLRQLFDQFGQDGFLAAYNAGPTRYAEARAGRRQLPAETVLYVARVERSILGVKVPNMAARTPSTVAWRTSTLFVEPASEAGVALTTGLFAHSNEGVTP